MPFFAPAAAVIVVVVKVRSMHYMRLKLAFYVTNWHNKIGYQMLQPRLSRTPHDSPKADNDNVDMAAIVDAIVAADDGIRLMGAGGWQ